MQQPPAYFAGICERAAKDWDLLDANPGIAGPWLQLFKQVQSPRHIVSELLQNADDAEATEAAVRIENGCFVFTHNGEDFSEEHFASLCRFGYSNKRALHTIGFRGIGFKSTFSLGDVVHLQTPTLSVSFERVRFTKPIWTNGILVHPTCTEIRVPISDKYREQELEKNLEEWLKSPVSLLFFRHLRRLQIGHQELHWASLGPGPVPDTEWMALYDKPDEGFLVARSEPEPFPPEALAEIKQERLLGVDEGMEFPPCKVEIVLGAAGRLYVVLPTGVETALPFATNAPFIQDPARLKIKDPETSPTNRWLLKRAGELAASVMMRWLGDAEKTLIERAGAYGLFPDVDRTDNSLEGISAKAVEEAFDRVIGARPFLLTHAGTLKPAKQGIVLPKELIEVWAPEEIAPLLDATGREPLCGEITLQDVEKLVHWGVVERLGMDRVLTALQSTRFPRPKTWRQLLRLWAYVAPEVTRYRYRAGPERNIRIVPVQGKDVLYAASEVVRLGERRLLQSDADWEFLSAHLLVLNQNWSRFLAEQRREADEAGESGILDDVEAGFAVLSAIGLEETSDANKVIERVTAEIFAQPAVTLEACVQLAQIAAKLGATAGDKFRFATRETRLRSVENTVMSDRDGTLEALFPAAWASARFLHPEYTRTYTSCSSEDWLRWVSSGRSGLVEFVPLTQTRTNVRRRQGIEEELRSRGFDGPPSYQYVTSNFVIEDWDFESVHWLHWRAAAKEEPEIWVRIADRILAQPESYWSKAQSARALQVATTGNTKSITYGPLLPTWILKLRELPCLPDTRGFYHRPAELLRRTPQTESLIELEPFVDGLLDNEHSRPLLILLGVRDSPTGPDRLLDCLRALARSDTPPVQEVEKWYRRLDQMLPSCSTADVAIVRAAFQDERLIFTTDSIWVESAGAFLNSDEDGAPGVSLVRAPVCDPALWPRVGVAERPTPELAIEWLKRLSSGQHLSQDEARRVRALLPRHATIVWAECEHWLNLAREWVPTATLEYALTMQTLVEWSHLHEWVKQKTADFSRLTSDIAETQPFSTLPRLSALLEERFHEQPLFAGAPEQQPWLNHFGAALCRIELDDEAERTHIRNLADKLASTNWCTTPGLKTIPYINGTPAGLPRRTDVVWIDRTLYVDQLPKPKLARIVPDRLGKFFGRTEIIAALNYCFGRSPSEVDEYLRTNFDLAPDTKAQGAAVVDTEVVGEPDREPSTVDGIVKPSDGGDRQSDAETDDTTAPPDDTEPTATVVGEVSVRRDRQHRRSVGPNILDRFARRQGFMSDGNGSYRHADGSCIVRTTEDQFPWERRTGSGEVVRRYWPEDHCLEREPLQLDADVWSLIEKHPDEYALILVDERGIPVELRGNQLTKMRDTGRLILFPATYRLVVKDAVQV
jgi:hypothetical protein